MSSRGPDHLVWDAAEKVRAFNHTTLSSGTDWEYPSHSYDALGALDRLAGILPQALEQALRPVTHTHAQGRIAIDGGGDADAEVRKLQTALSSALRYAVGLSETIGAMHAITGRMAVDTFGLRLDDDKDQEDGP